jgi:ADP-dependent NAD(P)H-hydrate dehydratase
VVLGPGTMDPEATGTLRDRLLDAVEDPVVILDAGALPGLDRPPKPRSVLIPNPGEMEGLLGETVADPRAAVVEACRRYGATIALRGPDTWITGPGRPVYVHRRGHPGLATSGSGDVLAGALGGLAACGADPLTATLWAVAVHAAAGRHLADRVAPVGFLARELLDELPAALDETRNSR